jgi:hypothetical protein
LSFTIRALQGIPTCLRSMRNSASGFEWCQVDSPFEPVLLADGESKGNWIVEGPVGISTRRDQAQITTRLAGGTILARHSVQAVDDCPAVDIQTKFGNTSSIPFTNLTSFGPLRMRFRNHVGQVRVHEIRSGLFVLEAVGHMDLAVSGKRRSATSSSCRR